MSSRLGIAGIVLLAAFGLAACGGGGGTSAVPTAGPTQAEQDAETIAALQKAERERLAAEAEAEAEKRAMAMAALGKAMYAALGATPLANIGDPTLSSAGLVINATAGAGSFETGTDPDGSDGVTLKAGESAGSLGGWAGTHYADTNATTKVVNAAVVYNNKGAGRSRSFAEAGYTVATETSGTAIKGYLLVVNTGTVVTNLDIMDVMADAFTHSGQQNHPNPDRSDAVYIRGTYDGAPGEYRCEGTDCSSTNDGKGSPSALGGTWHFKPDTGAMVHQPDATYLYYGWWVSKDKDSNPTAASAFTGVVAANQAAANDLRSAAGNTLTGSATYNGHAAGKFALNNPLDGTGDGGHFTADVELTAKFGDPTSVTGAGISGTVDNFVANDQAVDWSVALHRAGFGSDGAISAPVNDPATTGVNEALGTTWSIGDSSTAGRSGTWSGQMYDELPGNAPAGDGSNIPTTVTGTFYSEFGDQGRMVGAFGADKE